jgi:hypothetical protein
LKQEAIENDFSFSDFRDKKAVIIVGTGLLRELSKEEIDDYFEKVIDRTIEKFPDNAIVYPFHQITRDNIESLIKERYDDKIVCKRFEMSIELLVTNKNTRAVISTFSTVTSSINIMFPEIEQYYPDYNVEKLSEGELPDVYKGLMITKNYQVKYNNMKILKRFKVILRLF